MTNELTKDKTIQADGEYEHYSPEYTESGNAFYKEDVILAVEETIKRIESMIENDKYILPCKRQENQPYFEGHLDACKITLQIIKEQFPIVSESCKQERE